MTTDQMRALIRARRMRDLHVLYTNAELAQMVAELHAAFADNE
jgi:hypothetical protein